MNTRVAASATLPAAPILDSTRARAVESTGTQILRYALVLVFVLFGTAKYTAGEAMAIQPLVSNSPIMGWLYGVFSVRGASAAIGTIELVTALLIAARPISARVSAIGSALAIGTFLTTLSFLFSTPGALAPTHPAHGFLLKDIVLLAAAIATGGEALRAATEQSESAAR